MSDPVKAIALRLRHCCGEHAELTVERRESTEWQALLFDGARHRLTMRLCGRAPAAAVQALRSEIAHDDFPIPGHVVVDLRISALEPCSDGQRIEIEAVTIADDRDGSDRP